MRLSRKYIQWYFIVLSIGIFFGSTNAFKSSTVQEDSIIKAEQHLELSNQLPIVESKKDPLKDYEEENADLEVRSKKPSPNGEKVAYYQNKFVIDIESIGDSDYYSLIVESNGKKQAVFQGNFHLSQFEWLNDNEIKVYKGCGSSCLQSYVVNVNSMKYTEKVDQIFSFE